MYFHAHILHIHIHTYTCTHIHAHLNAITILKRKFRIKKPSAKYGTSHLLGPGTQETAIAPTIPYFTGQDQLDT